MMTGGSPISGNPHIDYFGIIPCDNMIQYDTTPTNCGYILGEKYILIDWKCKLYGYVNIFSVPIEIERAIARR